MGHYFSDIQYLQWEIVLYYIFLCVLLWFCSYFCKIREIMSFLSAQKGNFIYEEMVKIFLFFTKKCHFHHAVDLLYVQEVVTHFI